MKPGDFRNQFPVKFLLILNALLCAGVLSSLGQDVLLAQAGQAAPAQSQVMTTTTPTAEEAPKIPNDQLDSLVAPIALFSDPLLAQTLAASTYPLEIIQLQQWMDRNKGLKDKALADAVAKQPWDPSVQSLAAVPDVLVRLSSNIQWTTDLGNAFLAQQQDVMDAVQRMRAKAQGKGALKTSSEQVVKSESVEGGKQVIVIEPASTETVYVPSYDPVVVYGPPAYPYYPYSYPGYYAGMGLAFGAGMLWGSYWGGHWGDCNWGNGDVNINNKNNFNRNDFNRGNRPGQQPGRGQAGQGNRWQHRPEHRGNAPYGDRRTNDKFGQGNRGQGNRGQAGRPGAGTRPGGGAGASQLPAGGRGSRPGGAGAATRPSTGAGARPGGGAAGARPSTRPAGGGANKVGNRASSSRSYSNRGGGLSGGSGNYARASSNRGGRSMGGGGYSRGGYSRGGGGGFSRGGGGGRGGGGRGGGGRRR